VPSFRKPTTSRRKRRRTKSYWKKHSARRMLKRHERWRKKKEEDRKFAEKFIAQLLSLGYTEEQARAMLQKRRDKEQRETTIMDISKPTWIRVHRKYLAIETLDYYSLPWDWDGDCEYIVIKKWVSPEFQDELFAHSRRIFEVNEVKEKKLIVAQIDKDTVTTLKVRGHKKDQMYLVRKKSTGNARSKSPGFVCYTCKSTTVCMCDVGRGRSLGVVCVVCRSTTVCTCGSSRVRSRSRSYLVVG